MDASDLFGDFVYTYDANGNVGQLADVTPTSWAPGTVMVARYEYDPYGKVIGPDDDDDGEWTDDAGPYAAANPFRFSTKYQDDATGLVYYGYRYYHPKLGRWTREDPIGEDGGLNLYTYVTNIQQSDWIAWAVEYRAIQPRARRVPKAQVNIQQKIRTLALVPVEVKRRAS